MVHSDGQVVVCAVMVVSTWRMRAPGEKDMAGNSHGTM